ncbi:hypothetical protein GE09DRAFT_1224637 [Coniochaeta sp. 2T2.1]|nr:hypothetical protein GE09DRAFT_1224637 [Coniochaeta sp. 2T2.1]
MSETPHNTMSAESLTSPRVLSFDSMGDLILRIGTPPTSCEVCSRTVARSSPVFKSMLDKGFWVESKPDDGDWVVNLPADNIVGFSILLLILHGHIRKVPSTLAEYRTAGPKIDTVTDILYQVAKTADKPGASEGRLAGSAPLDCVALGDEHMVNDELYYLVLSAYIRPISEEDEDHIELAAFNKNGDTVSLDFPSGEENEIIEIMDISDRVAKKRMHLLRTILEAARSLLDREALGNYTRCFRHDTDNAPAWGPPTVSKAEGGKLLHRYKYSLGMAGLWPFPTAENYRGSVSELQAQILDVQRAFVGRSAKYERFCASRGCDPTESMINYVDELLRPPYYVSSPDWGETESRRVCIPLSKKEKARLELRREKSGLQMARSWS